MIFDISVGFCHREGVFLSQSYKVCRNDGATCLVRCATRFCRGGRPFQNTLAWKSSRSLDELEKWTHICGILWGGSESPTHAVWLCWLRHPMAPFCGEPPIARTSQPATKHDLKIARKYFRKKAIIAQKPYNETCKAEYGPFYRCNSQLKYLK